MPIGFRGRSVAIAVAVALLAAGSAASRTVAATAAAPKAIFSTAQASAGSKAYAANCASCHGANLEGGVGPALSGANLKTLSKNTKLTVHDLFTFMSQQMPMNAPASLSKDQYVAIMAYVLKYNGYPAGSTALTYAGALKSTMPVTSLK
jgi:polar amino acid transport system substrate-binding protein